MRKKKKEEDEANYIYLNCAVLGKILSGDSFVFAVKRIQNVEVIKASDLEKLVKNLKDREKEYEE